MPKLNSSSLPDGASTGEPRSELLNQCSEVTLRALLEEATNNAEPGDALLEGSIERERAYAQRSLIRWHEIVQKVLTLPNRGVCLDIGTSPLTLVLPRFFKEVHTLDYTDNMKSRCEKASVILHSGGISAESGNIRIPVPTETFDCIIFLEVLEHLHFSPVDLLRVLQEKLKPGGTLLLSTPNMMCLGNRIRMLANRRLNSFSYPPFSANDYPQHGHQHDRLYMPAEMVDYFNQTGWSAFKLGYHCLKACDAPEETGWRGLISKLLKQPLKSVFPSLRQLMLIEARK